MTANEFQAALKAMSPEEKVAFRKRAGCGDYDDEMCLHHFLMSTDWQSKFCFALGVPSQADKVASATVDAATFAKWGYKATLWALGVAIVSAILSYR